VTDPRVLARLAAAPARGTHLRWWFTKRPFALRPVWALAALAAALVAGAGLGSRLLPAPGTGRDAPAAPETRAAAAEGGPVTFVLRAPGATRVSVVGDFNHWDAEATPMAHGGSGDLWVLSLRLPRGVHHYAFVLDGTEWRPDPAAPLAADDAFGGHNSVIVVNGSRGM
jgi:hypothetical protein